MNFRIMNYEAVVVGASAGGIPALQTILALLPADFRLPLFVAQHRWPAQDDFMSFTLNEACRLVIKEAEQNERIQAGHVYLAPANYHLLLEQDYSLSLSVDDKVRYSRPSIDVLFETAADVYRSQLIGVILSGANSDGTAGFRKIKKMGGITIAQDPSTAEVHIMPDAAIRENVVDKVFSLPEIASYLIQLSRKGINYD